MGGEITVRLAARHERGVGKDRAQVVTHLTPYQLAAASAGRLSPRV